MNMQDFYTGHAFDAYEFFGAHTYFGGTHFAVWAPSAQHIAVETEIGTFDLHRTQSAVWECDAPGVQAGMVYQYWVRGANGQSVAHCDPYGTAMTLRPDGRSIVSDAPKGFADDKWMQERTKCFDKPLNIYEVHACSWRQKEDGSWYTYAALAETAAGATRPPAFLRPPAATARRTSLWSLSTPATSRGSALSWTLCRSTLPWMPTV